MGLLLTILFAVYAIGAAAALVYLWRQLKAVRSEVAELRHAVGARAPAQQTVRRVRSGLVVPIDASSPGAQAEDEGPRERAARTWRTPGADRAVELSEGGPLARVVLSPETLRGLVLGMLATAPALGFFFRADPPIIVASGLAIAAAMMVIALRPVWSVAAWASISTAAAWASLGFALGAAHADPVSYSICAGFAGAAGLLHAHLRRATPGAALALAMSAAALALASQTGMIGPAGAAFGVIVALAAIVGAMSLRLETMHLAAFGAAVIGLFVLSGQPSAAIWFTPATTWAGALFLGIAAIRVPHLGARGVAIAGTGAFGALGAILALNTAQHGLAHPYAAAGALLALAAVLGCVIASSALRRERGLHALRFSLWMLALAGFGAVIAAIVLALPPPLASFAFALAALGMSALNARFPEGTWRAFAGGAALLALPFSAISAEMVLSEAPGWPAWLLVASGLCAPAALLGGAAFLAARHDALKLSALLELLVIGLAVSAASLLVRLVFSEGALLLQPVGFVETGVHSAAWLMAALIIGSRAHLGARPMRVAAINLLTLAALGVMATATLLWMTDYWAARSGAGPALLTRDTLGFLIPAVLCFAHWVFWRARSDDLQTRLVFGASMLLFAAFITVEAIRAENIPDWARALVGAVSFAMALGLNFSPGIVNADGPPQRGELQKQFHRNGRRQQRAQTRQHAR
ncbi:MAG TPA: hypothetical protein VEF55_04675 [Candidatus Binatia bacterium]|nr:hypothetical protein [Candidatus Binatia bacterium]